MIKTIDIKLNDFPATPNRLRQTPAVDRPLEYISLDLARLFFHYVMDNWGPIRQPLNIANFEYLEHLAPCDDFRFRAGGTGASTERRTATSNLLGRAFCRHVLHEFLNIPYFAELKSIIGKTPHPAFEGLRITRTSSGDTPDYLCARNVRSPMLAEAKGRSSSIGFGTREFEEWRRQFCRVEFKWAGEDTPRAVKGYICATQLATAAKPKLRSCVYLEDPSTPGEPFSRGDEVSNALGRAAILGHYSRVSSQLGLSLLAASLHDGFTVPEQVQMELMQWQMRLPETELRRFIGGFVEPIDRWSQIAVSSGGPVVLAEPVFVGLDLTVARRLRRAAAGDWNSIDDIEPIRANIIGSNYAMHDDGTVIGPVTMFQPLGTTAL